MREKGSKKMKKKTFQTVIFVSVSTSELNALGHIDKGRVLVFLTYLNISMYCSKRIYSTLHNFNIFGFVFTR